jgi:hypothetical protein
MPLPFRTTLFLPRIIGRVPKPRSREISTPWSIPECLERLRDGGLVHPYYGLASATHAAVRCDEIDQGRGSCEAQRSLEDAILALMLDRAEGELAASSFGDR